MKVTLMDAIGRELLDENGPKMSWDIEPHHPGLQYKATDRLFVEHHPEYIPVPVPYKYYQVGSEEFYFKIFWKVFRIVDDYSLDINS